MSATDRQRQLILVVDDDLPTRIMVSAFLEQQGYAVAEADNGRAALEAFDRLGPQAVLLDARMPVMDGFTACRELRKRPGGEHLPIMMITGLDDVDSLHLAYEAGATDFAAKPFKMVLIGYRLRYLLRSSRALRRLAEADDRAGRRGPAIDAALAVVRSTLKRLRQAIGRCAMATDGHAPHRPADRLLGEAPALIEEALEGIEQIEDLLGSGDCQESRDGSRSPRQG